MNIKPEQIPDETASLALEVYDRSFKSGHDSSINHMKAAIAAALPVLLGEPVAWMDPASRDVINAERKHEWMTYFGAGGKVKAELYTLPIYTLPTQDTPNADQ